jgi:predicted XRE-type DNA-binding protein
MIKMNTEPIEIEQGSDNPWQDLALPDAADMQIKASLAQRIGAIIQTRRLSQTAAASLLCMPQPTLSNMLNGQFRGISQAKMLEMLNRLGQDVAIVIKPGLATVGQTGVVLA